VDFGKHNNIHIGLHEPYGTVLQLTAVYKKNKRLQFSYLPSQYNQQCNQ